ncbi:MAG: NFYB/HAP3 family transcription factor subunit [Candidatus Aenigmarchaeota archaeon]|nr:NFYB/HAP3 family transcription factor subunit [Candidatus Aenigmarchaeota archaeon]
MIPKAAIERTARKAGVVRISEEALDELQKTIEEIGFELSKDAAEAAKHAKRKTIDRSDIELISCR